MYIMVIYIEKATLPCSDSMLLALVKFFVVLEPVNFPNGVTEVNLGGQGQSLW